MKKLMWAISILSLVVTAVVLQGMPDAVPMHYDLAGTVDRWGSKYENFLFPVIILLLSLHWHLFAAYFEKKAAKASAEKERVEALSNAKVMWIVGLSMAAAFTVMQGIILYNAYREAAGNAAQAHPDIGRVSCMLIGIMLLFLGNYMPKTKRNPVAGVRAGWAAYNDATWRKSNRFGGVSMMIAGLLTIITTPFVRSATAVGMLLAYLLIAAAVTLLYSHKVYKAELSKNKSCS